MCLCREAIIRSGEVKKYIGRHERAGGPLAANLTNSTPTDADCIHFPGDLPMRRTAVSLMILAAGL